MICDLLESGLRGKKARRLNRTLSRFDGPPPIMICLRVQMSRVMHEAAPSFLLGDTATEIGAGL
jgi:hypothetical protein